jgi:hypothetical protein
MRAIIKEFFYARWYVNYFQVENEADICEWKIFRVKKVDCTSTEWHKSV